MITAQPGAIALLAGAYMQTAAYPYMTETRTGPRGRALGPTITMRMQGGNEREGDYGNKTLERKHGQLGAGSAAEAEPERLQPG